MRDAVLSGSAGPFHAASFPQGHAPTAPARRMAAREPYSVPYAEFYEPYVVAARSALPPADERFTGYGLNKCALLYAAAARGMSFTVLPHCFAVAADHPDHAFYTGKKFAAHYYARNVVPSVEAIARVLDLADTSAIDIPDNAFATV